MSVIEKPRRSKPPSRRRDRDAEPAADKPQDAVLIRGKTEDGKGLSVLRLRGEQLETGAVRPLEEGKPIHGEVVRLHPRPSLPMVCDVEVEVPASEPADASLEARKGPAQVSSARYRRNWDAIWRSKKRELPN